MHSSSGISVARYDGPDLIYGMWREMYLVVIDRAWAERAAAEIESIRSASTWGAAYRAGLEAEHITCPIEEDLYDHEPGDAFDWDLVTADDDWPPMVSLYTARDLPRDWPIGEDYRTTFSGDGVVILPEEEGRLLAIAEAAGAPLTRDDNLVGRLDPNF